MISETYNVTQNCKLDGNNREDYVGVGSATLPKFDNLYFVNNLVDIVAVTAVNGWSPGQ